MCKQILHDFPQGPLLTLCSSLAITWLAFIGSSSCTGYWALEYESLPGCLEVINSQPRVLFGPTSAEIWKKGQWKEAVGGRHFTLDDITSNILALKNRQGHGWLARLHGARAKDPLLMLWTNPRNCPAVCWFGWRARVLFICSTGLIDSVSLHACSHRAANILVTPKCKIVVVALKCLRWSVSPGRCPMWHAWAVSPSCCWRPCTLSVTSRAGGAESRSYTQVTFVHTSQSSASRPGE